MRLNMIGSRSISCRATATASTCQRPSSGRRKENHFTRYSWRRFIIGTAACLVVYEIALLISDDSRIALWAGITNALYVPIAIFCVRLYSETVALALVAIVAYLLVRLVKWPTSPLVATLLGAAMALLSLTKLIFVPLPGAVLPLLVLLGRGHRLACVKSGAIALAAMAVVLLPWIALNYSIHGTFASGNSTRMAIVIYCRVHDRGIAAVEDIASEVQNLEKSGVPTKTINRIYEKKVLDSIREHPFRYLAGTLEQFQICGGLA
jgi:4-amino-4-deoxy-L-arabinose transferase-like glycosyltransferase